MKRIHRMFPVVFAALLAAACFTLAGCGKRDNPVVTQSTKVYDIAAGGDYEVGLDLKDGRLTGVKNGGEVVDSTEYLYREDEGKLVLYAVYMQFLEYGTYTFTVTTDKGSATFEVEVKNSVTTSFDTERSKNYTYGSGQDLAFSADFSTASVTRLETGGRALPSSVYAYGEGKLTLKGGYLDTLYGTTEFTVTLSNNDAYTFSVVSDCLFNANFEYDEAVINLPWINNMTPAVADGFDGRALHYVGYGSGGNLFVFGNNASASRAFGLDLPFDENKIYRLTFDMKNCWAEDFDSFHTLGFNAFWDNANQGLFMLNYDTNEMNGGIVEYDADSGVYSVTLYFQGPADTGFTNGYAGYKPEESAKKMCDLLFDNILLVEAEIGGAAEIPVSRQTYIPGSRADLTFSGSFGGRTVKSVAVKGGAALAAEDYQAFTYNVKLYNAYLDGLTADTTFVATLSDDSTVEFTVNLAKARPTTFTADSDVSYRYGSNRDIAFGCDFGKFSIKSVTKKDGTAVDANSYTLAGDRFVVKHEYLNTLAGKNEFIITLDNAGQVEGKVEDETHAFTITSSAVYVQNFETAGFDTGFSGTCPEVGVLEDGIDGKSYRFSGTGGQFLTFGKATDSWPAGYTEVPFATGTYYRAVFDIKAFNEKYQTNPNIIFFFYGSTVSGISIAEGAVVAREGGHNVLTVTDRGEGVYRVDFLFKYAADMGGGLGKGLFSVEADMYQQGYYDLLVDNIAFYAMDMSKSATYVYGSGKDVSYNVDFTALASLKNGETVIDPSLYSVAFGRLTLDADYCETLTGSVALTAVLEDETTQSFLLSSTKLYFNDFNGENPDTSFMFGSKLSLVDSWLEGGGKALKARGDGGTLLAFGTKWLDNMTFGKLPFVVGKSYRMSFDIKMDASDNPTNHEFGMGGQLVGEQFLSLNFDNGACRGGTAAKGNTAAATWDAENKAFHVTITFTVAADWVMEGWPGYADGTQEFLYSWVFDNILMESIPE